MSSATSAEKPFRNPVTGRAIGEKAMLVVLAVIIAVPALIVLISSLKTQGAIIKSPLSIPTNHRSKGTVRPKTSTSFGRFATAPGWLPSRSPLRRCLPQ
jgi:ABC-type glycerol-3-phosphate transport system permease component